MENEELSPATEGGAADTGAQQDAQGASQGAVEGQSTESPKVDRGESQASSSQGQARQNFNWANQRVLEKAVSKIVSSALEERLRPLVERLTPQPPAQTTPTNDIDYNDLPGSIQRLVENALKQKESVVNKTLPELKKELLTEISTQTSRQEARKYLQSQKDIGLDKSKHEEIEDIIVNDELLYHAVEKYPVKVMQEAIRRWRSSKTNPLTPGRDELSTVAGGMGAARRGEPSSQRIKELVEKSTGILNNDEREKLNAQIEELTKSLR